MKKALALMIIGFFFFSCKEDCNETKISEITNVSGPSEGTVNEAIPIELTFTVNNGCGEFERFDEIGGGKTRTVRIIAEYDGCICATVIKTIEETYQFKTSKPGIHTLNFESPDGSVITHTIAVKE